MSEAFAAARELLQQAQEEAARLRADAERYVSKREQEAELLVAKARRLLEVAEGRAAAIVAAPVADSERPLPRHLVAEGVARPGAISTGSAPGPATPAPPVVVHVDAGLDAIPDSSLRIRSDLDRMLADAIAKAVDRSFTHEP